MFFLLNIFIVQYNLYKGNYTLHYTFNTQILRTFKNVKYNKFLNRASQSFALISQPFGRLKRSTM